MLRVALLAGLTAAACGPKVPPAPPTAIPSGVGETITTPGQLCREGGRTWTIVGSDGPVARTRGRCLGKEARGWHFISQLLPADADTPDFEFHLWLGRDGSPRHAQLREPRRVTHYRWSDRQIHIRLHGDLRVLERPDDTPVWVLPRHAVYLRELMFRMGVGLREAGVLQVGYVPARDAVVPLPLRIELEGSTITARADQGIFELEADERPHWATVRITRGMTGDGTPVYEEANGPATWEAALPEKPNPTYTLAPALMSVPVEIPALDGHPKLAGELVARKDADARPHCGVVFLSGSGSQDRLGFVPNTSIDVGSHEIHDALARAGCVVLRFDDRGVGQSDRGPSDAGYQALVSDARRAIAFLARRGEVNPSRIVVVGHSEGALTAVLLANERFKVGRRKHALAGIVALGLVGRNLREVLYSQVRVLSRGKPESEVEAEVEKARKIHDRLLAGETPAEIAPVATWMREIFAIEPLDEFRKVRIPALLLQGGKDFQVDPTLDFEPLRKALESNRRPKGEARLLEGLDHLLKPEPGESKVGHYSDLSRRVDVNAIQLIVGWVTTTTGSAP